MWDTLELLNISSYMEFIFWKHIIFVNIFANKDDCVNIKFIDFIIICLNIWRGVREGERDLLLKMK